MTDQRVSLLHGEGGAVMRSFLRDFVALKLDGAVLQLDSDAADLGTSQGHLALTTDSFVVSPLFFPGGDIGTLAVYGTVNDLAVAGARPMFLTLSMIIEEGFAMESLDRVLTSVAEAARESEIQIVAGDTKVVPKGAADGLFLNTAGVGRFHQPRLPGPANLTEGVDLIVSGPIGRHGLAILCERESLGFTPRPRSDCAPLRALATALQTELGAELFAMRDATRGGVAAVLHEWSEASDQAMWIDESKIPVTPADQGICEVLGLDPLFIANEGTLVAAVSHKGSHDAVEILRRFSIGKQACVIGEVRNKRLSPVIVHRRTGIDQPLDEPMAAMLPRIC